MKGSSGDNADLPQLKYIAPHTATIGSRRELTYAMHIEVTRLASAFVRRKHDPSNPPTVALPERIRQLGARMSSDDRARYFIDAARIVRTMLVSHATLAQLPTTRSANWTPDERETYLAILDVEKALTELESSNPLSARMVEIHYFAGLSEYENAKALGVPVEMVQKSLRFARVWLTSKMQKHKEARRPADKS